MEEEKRKLIGEILIEQGKITEADIQEALKEQKTNKIYIGKILIAKGLVSSTDILAALSLQDKIRKSNLSLVNRLKYKRIPIRVRLSIFITLLIVIIMSFLSFFYVRSQVADFIIQTTRVGKAIVVNLAYNSSVPLLEDDEATLHILLAEVAKIEDIDYAMILDKAGVIKAHTDVNKINTPYEPLKNTMVMQKVDNLEIQKYQEGKKEILNFSTPVEFNKVNVGAIHVGISLESLQKKISKTRLFVMTLTFLIVLAGIGISFLISTKFSKPIHMLVSGTREIKNGNYDHRIELLSNDEIGDLTTAFNDMADGLQKKEIIQDAFGKYVTPEIVDLILENPGEKWLKGEKIDVTVMFADIRGFTSFSEKTEPEKVVSLLNDHFTMATEIIFKYGGHVDKFIGDEIMAVFGALAQYEDHAARALTAAVALQDEIKAANIKLEGSGKNPVKIGIGLNSGEVIAGNIGSQKRMEYTVIGDTVNLASRVTRLAGPDEVIISDFVYRKVADIAIVEELDPVTVKGKSAPIQTYRVKGLTQQNA